jgi:hypothetical protein
MPNSVMGYKGRVMPLYQKLDMIQNPTLGSQLVNVGSVFAVPLPPCATWVIPGGSYNMSLGPYSLLQFYDTVGGFWRSVESQNGLQNVDSDGSNWRIANLTGSPVAGIITNAGSGLTNGFNTVTVTPSAGGSTWKTVVGGAINATITITAGGAGYTIAPLLFIDPPPAGGVQATATCTISGGAINAVTVTNQGAGYSTAPLVTIVNQAGDTTGAGGVLTVNATLAGSGTLTAMIALTPGTVLTAVPTFTFSPASTIAATAVMCVTSTAVTTTGLSHAGNGSLTLIGSALTAGSSVLVNPAINTGFFTPQIGYCAPQTAAGACVIYFGGLHQAAPQPVTAVTSDGTISAATTYGTNTFGGTADISYVQVML